MNPTPSLQFVVPGEPKALKRHRTRVMQSRGGRAFAQQYDPAENQAVKGGVRDCGYEAMLKNCYGSPLPGPLCVRIDFRMVVPQSKVLKRPQGILRLSAESLVRRFFHTSKPDIDNLCKLVFDALNGVVWRDDTQIVDLRATKHYTNGIPRTLVQVWEAEITDSPLYVAIKETANGASA